MPGRCRSPTDFFDAIVSIDSFFYYGTDDLYLNYLARFVKPGGPMGIAGAGLVQEIDGPIPDHLREWWTQDHVVPAFGGLVAPALGTDRHRGHRGGRHHARRLATLAGLAPGDLLPTTSTEIKALEADRGSYLGYARVVGRRNGQATLGPHVVSVPSGYVKQPLLRSEDSGPHALTGEQIRPTAGMSGPSFGF